MTLAPITVCLVGCGKAKLDRPAAAKSLYTGTLFRAARAYAETCDDWRIISALYGTLNPDDVITPYDARPVRWTNGEAAQWGQAVANRIVGDFLECGPYELVILAGEDYARPIVSAMREGGASEDWRCNCVGVRTPLRGLGIGARMAWFAKEMRA